MKLIFLVLIFTITNCLHGQYRIKISVLGNGGSSDSNLTYHLNSTLGQQLTGITQASNYTVYDGVWKPIQILTPIDNQNNIIPQKYELEQNYPNPFNPSTKIKYAIPRISQVEIKIYDILGNVVQTLVNEEKSAGVYELIWNAADLSSGVYFYQIHAGNFVQTKKMLLLK